MGESAVHTPGGPVRGARFGGLLEGRVGDRVALERAVRELAARGPAEPVLEVEGARFTLQLEPGPVGAGRATPARMEALLEELGAVVATTGDPGSIVSTLQCTELYDDEVVETLIEVEDGAVRPVSRVRPRTVYDPSDPVPTPPGRDLSPRVRNRIIGAVSLVLVVLISWESGLFDRVFGAPASSLAVELGPVAPLLDVSLTSGLGLYRVKVARGERYPTSAAEVEALETGAASPLARAAVDVLAGGGVLEVRVVGEGGRVLERADVPTSPLLSSAEASVEVDLPARIGARALAFGLHTEGSR